MANITEFNGMSRIINFLCQGSTFCIEICVKSSAEQCISIIEPILWLIGSYFLGMAGIVIFESA